MPLMWRATAESKGVIHVNEMERLLRVRTRVVIYDTAAPAVVIKSHVFDTTYKIPWFIGMSMAEIRDAIVEDGIQGVASLRAIATGMLDDWIDSAVFRALPLPYNFEPLGS